MIPEYKQNVRDSDEKSPSQLGMISQLRKTGFLHPREIRYEVIHDIDGVLDCLKLRYITYRYANFIEENKDTLDIDQYDEFSTYLGAYDVTGNKKILVGSLRIISGDRKSDTAVVIQELVSRARDPQLRSLGERPKRFPIMESFSLPRQYLRSFTASSLKAKTSHFYPYELSRLTVRPDYWMQNIEIGLHHLLILDSWLHNPARNDFIIAVHPRTRRGYERIGFQIIPGSREVLYKHINQLAIAMVLDLKEYLTHPRSYQKICESLLPFYQEHGFFTRVIERRNSRNHSR